MYLRIKKLLVACMVMAPLVLQGQVVINEVCTSNGDLITDPDFDNFSGWVELFNGGSAEANVGGWYLSDESARKTKWRLPAGARIPAGGLLLIWCDEMNTGYHTNFTIDPDGSRLFLSNSAGVVNEVELPAQYLNVSYGRKQNGSAEWSWLEEATPGRNNPNRTLSGVLDPVTFSIPPGRYGGSQGLVLSHADSQAEIRFTTDGSEPSANSARYTNPISIATSTVVKARAFKAGRIPGISVSQTFFISEHAFTLPVVSIATDPGYLTDPQMGIYISGSNGVDGNCSSEPRNWNQDWDRHATLEYFSPQGASQLGQHVDIRIGGACSRNFPQKSLVVKAREKYGDNSIEHRFFAGKHVERLGGFMLRNSGNDFYGTMFRDAFLQWLPQGQMDIDYMAYQPAAVYINGDYWGIQNIREKIDGDYLRSNFGLRKDEIDLIETWGNAIEGSSDHYFTYLDSLSQINRTTPDAFAFIERHIDVQEFINYLCAEIYYANTDWPGNNIKFWRKRDGGKYRWILWDTDFGFGLYQEMSYPAHPTLDFATDPDGENWPNPAWSTLHLRLLLQNPTFRTRFVQTFATAIGVTFHPDRVIDMIDAFATRIQNEIPFHVERWGQSAGGWQSEVQRLRNFANERHAFMQGHLTSFFGFSQQVRVSMAASPEGTGAIQLNGVTTRDPVSDRFYLKNLPYEMKPVPEPGYQFSHWEIQERSGEHMTLISMNDTWRYFDLGGNAGAGWFQPAFDDASWSDGEAQLGYGEGDEATTVNYGPDAQNKYITTYFRKSFEVSDTTGIDDMTLRCIFDDGIAIYLNGNEISRMNLPGGTISHLTLAGGQTPAEGSLTTIVIPRQLLRPGENVLAAEVHQSSVQSTDVSFALELTTYRSGDTISRSSDLTVLSDTAMSDLSVVAVFEPKPAASDVIINEVSAWPGAEDDFGDSEDFIELYNAGSAPVDLADMFISDDAGNKLKHRIVAGTGDETILNPGEYKVFYADGEPTHGARHLSFKLSQSGEYVGLYQRSGASLLTLDDFEFGQQWAATSYSRIPDITGDFVMTETLTPGSENMYSTPVAIEHPQKPAVRIYPNPAANIVNIESVQRQVLRTELRDLQGRLVRVGTSASLGLHGVAPGIYILRAELRDETVNVKLVVKENGL